MEVMQAKKLFSPPDKMDGTKVHLINMANKSFETLAMDLADLCPKSEHLDEVIHEINKARLLFNHSIEIMKTGKNPEPPKVVEKPKRQKKVIEQPEDENNEEEIEGFES